MSNCSLSIESLANDDFCQNNMSGVKTMYFIPKNDVTAINAALTTNKTTFTDYVEIGSTAMEGKAFTVATGKGFAKLYSAKDLGELKYQVQGGTSGNRSFHATIEIHHPGFRRKLLAFLGIAANMEFILLVQLANGEWHLLGDTDRAAQLSDGTEASSGKASADPNGATLTFEYDCPLPRIMFTGWSPDNPVYGVEMFRVAWLLADEDGVVLTDENDLPLEIPCL